MGLESQVPGDDHLLAQLAVQRQLRVEAVALQVQDQHPEWGDSSKQHRQSEPLLPQCVQVSLRCVLSAVTSVVC